jgi:hypothetical protein
VSQHEYFFCFEGNKNQLCISCISAGILDKTVDDTTLQKKVIDFPFPAGMSLTKLSLAGNYEINPGQGKFG